MAKRKVPAAAMAPQIFAASLGANGAVIKANGITQPHAEALRRAGLDVVVCGPDLAANRKLAGQIENNANGACKRCPPHRQSGIKALPHYQSDPRPQPAIRSMKHRTDAPFDQPMRFFTPDLYLRFNSSDDEIADLANDDWEKALGAYEAQLSRIQDKLSEQPRKLAELSLHDYELLGWDDSMQPDLRPTGAPIPAWSAVTVLSLRRRDEVVSLNYVLWDNVRRHPAPKTGLFRNFGCTGSTMRSISRPVS